MLMLMLVIITKFLLIFILIGSIVSGEKQLNETFVCGNTAKMLNDCFEELSPDLLEFLTTTKIPVTQKEIHGKCTVFRQGMACIDKYTKQCIESDKKKIFDSNVFGAKTFLNALCDNSKFQTEYLRHKDCFIFIKDDWQKCSTKFINILSDELHSSSAQSKNVSSRFMQFCCSRYAYERCIFNSAKFKCHKHSALFVRAVVRMLSTEKHFNNCGKFESLMCSSANAIKSNNLMITFVIVFCMVFLNKFHVEYSINNIEFLNSFII